jgi:hypothetical protein
MNGVIVPARKATNAGGIDSLKSFLAPKKFKKFGLSILIVFTHRELGREGELNQREG